MHRPLHSPRFPSLSPRPLRTAPALLIVAALFVATNEAPERRRAEAAEPEAGVGRVDFRVRTDVALQELSPDFCWFHPRAAALPGHGSNGRPAVVLTLQKHLIADDHYSGLYFMRSNDLGRTWTKPTLPPELDWRPESPDVTIAVCDATPGWHAPSGKLLVVGTKLRYSKTGAQLLDQPRSHQCAYATYDPRNDRWTAWKMLDLPGSDDKFFLVAPGCVQWLVRPDGQLLIPVYFRGPTGDDYVSTVLQCTFDGERLDYVRHGDELRRTGGRGYVEPSLVRHRDKYYLTLRNDERAYVTSSDDGLRFAPPVPWRFDDGSELGSYNTQAHWLAHSDGLFLAYTRRGLDNDRIPRHRAPLLAAEVDPQRLTVRRSTERTLIPERGVMLGNFGAAAITPDESWVTDAEFIVNGMRHPRGADGSVYTARLLWSRPNGLLARP